MADERGFTLNYEPLAQKEFQEFLQEGKLDQAYQALRGMISPSTPEEAVQRMITLIQGYEMIIQSYKKKLGDKPLEEIHKNTQMLEKLLARASISECIEDSENTDERSRILDELGDWLDINGWGYDAERELKRLRELERLLNFYRE